MDDFCFRKVARPDKRHPWRSSVHAELPPTQERDHSSIDSEISSATDGTDLLAQANLWPIVGSFNEPPNGVDTIERETVCASADLCHAGTVFRWGSRCAIIPG